MGASLGTRGEGSRGPPLRYASVVWTILLSCLATAAPLQAEPPLVRLAESLAAEIRRVAEGHDLELLLPEDRTTRDGRRAADLRDLLLARLEGSVRFATEGPRLTVTPVLSEDPRRLLASARVVLQPQGRLVDLVSVSVETDPSSILPFPIRPPPTRGIVEIVSATRTPPLEKPVLDLALVDDQRLVLLHPDSATLVLARDASLAVRSELSLPGPLLPVRATGGVIVRGQETETFWLLTNRTNAAVLVAIQGDRLVEQRRAGAIPWPNSAQGLRYRTGTNLLEGLPSALGSGPHLALAADGRLAVSSAGALLRADGDTGLRVGPSLASLWPGLLAASSAEPPGAEDSVLILSLESEPPRVVDSFAVEGAIRALGARARGDRLRLVAGVDLAASHHLLFLELARIALDVPPDSRADP